MLLTHALASAAILRLRLVGWLVAGMCPPGGCKRCNLPAAQCGRICWPCGSNFLFASCDFGIWAMTCPGFGARFTLIEIDDFSWALIDLRLTGGFTLLYFMLSIPEQCFKIEVISKIKTSRSEVAEFD